MHLLFGAQRWVRLQASWRGIRAVSAAPDGQSMDMAVPDDVGTLITSNHTGIVDDIYFLLFIEVRTPKSQAPFARCARQRARPCGDPRTQNTARSVRC